MKSIRIQEQKRYTRDELLSIFNDINEQPISIIKKLKELNILKTVHNNKDQAKMTDLLEENIEIVDEEEMNTNHYYVFTFVGIILVSKVVLKCYPKYLKDITSETESEEKLKLIVRVLQKYNNYKEQIVSIYLNDDNNAGFNLLAATVYLMNDYYENGIYTNEQSILELNGNGEIDWNRTIDSSCPILKRDNPYYVELKTRQRVADDFDYIKKLHEIVLTQCSKRMNETGLMNLFSLSEIELSDENLESLGERDYILKRINDEKQIQFNTRKLELLSAIEAYISHKGAIQDLNNFSVFGTNTFNLVWEEACKKVLSNQLRTLVCELELPDDKKEDYEDRDKDLLSIIKKPKWTSYTGNSHEEGRLIPDMITVGKVNGKYEFNIFDAKYYNTFIEREEVRGQPGIESIVKQYVYQMAYKEFIELMGIDKVNNCFIMPMDNEGEENTLVKLEGSVEMEIFDMDPIKVRKLQAEKVFENYLAGTKIDIRDMRL